MAERWVVNASPVILLAKAEVIRLLPQLCDELVIPSGVVGEVRNARITDAGGLWLQEDGKQFVLPSPPITPELLNWKGGAGEAEVISWALQNEGFTAILDDRRARHLAKSHRVPVLGSPGYRTGEAAGANRSGEARSRETTRRRPPRSAAFRLQKRT